MSNANENFIVEGKGYAESLGKGAVKICFEGTISAADTRDMAHKLIFLADIASGATKCGHGRIKDHCAVCLLTIQAAKLPEGFRADNEWDVENILNGCCQIDIHSDGPINLDHGETLNLIAWLMVKADIQEHELRLAQTAVALEIAKDKP